MKNKKKLIITIVCSSLLVIIGVVFVFYQFFNPFSGLFDEGPIKKVNLAGWEKLEQGMTKQQVIELLGDSERKSGPSKVTFGEGEEKEEISIPERWEYNYTIGISLFGGVHDKAYVVYFDKKGLLDYWREPIHKEEKQSQKITSAD